MRALLSLVTLLLMSSPGTTMAEEEKEIGTFNPKDFKRIHGDWKKGTKHVDKKVLKQDWARKPIFAGPVAGGEKNVTDSNDKHLVEISEFVVAYLSESNSGLHFVQVDAKVQVVAGLLYTLHYKGNDDDGVCQEEHELVVFDKPWADERYVKSDEKMDCT